LLSSALILQCKRRCITVGLAPSVRVFALVFPHSSNRGLEINTFGEPRDPCAHACAADKIRAIRVTKLGAGLRVPSLRSEDIADALRKATTDHTMIEKAARIGERIRKENGVDNAVNAIHYNIVRAASDRSKMQWAK
jgi:hypothetical protein